MEEATTTTETPVTTATPEIPQEYYTDGALDANKLWAKNQSLQGELQTLQGKLEKNQTEASRKITALTMKGGDFYAGDTEQHDSFYATLPKEVIEDQSKVSDRLGLNQTQKNTLGDILREQHERYQEENKKYQAQIDEIKNRPGFSKLEGEMGTLISGLYENKLLPEKTYKRVKEALNDPMFIEPFADVITAVISIPQNHGNQKTTMMNNNTIPGTSSQSTDAVVDVKEAYKNADPYRRQEMLEHEHLKQKFGLQGATWSPSELEKLQRENNEEVFQLDQMKMKRRH